MSHPDPLRTVLLDNGYAASVCVTPDGRDVLWLLANGSPDVDDDYGCSCERCAPHEYPGHPLPPRITQMLDRPTQPRCGRPRAAGQPCRTPVARTGLTCHWHRTAHRGGTP